MFFFWIIDFKFRFLYINDWWIYAVETIKKMLRNRHCSSSISDKGLKVYSGRRLHASLHSIVEVLKGIKHMLVL